MLIVDPDRRFSTARLESLWMRFTNAWLAVRMCSPASADVGRVIR